MADGFAHGTVTGAAPLVDTQNVKQQKAVSAELLSALPSGTSGLMMITRLVPVSQIPKLVATGKIVHSLVVVALYHFELWRRPPTAD